uniref:Ska2 N-terminal domain-containing protein n=1 Tax=Nyssomyia neivai TaxID=330878 RepID=A0A1L8D7K7_9DIPT
MTDESYSKLQNSVDYTGSQLDIVAMQLSKVEKILPTECQESDVASVMELLDTMSDVKNEYKNLKKDLQEVQQLQKQMTNSLRYQMNELAQTFNLLKKRIESTAPSPPPN